MVITNADARELLRRYGAGEIDVTEAAQQIRPAYLEAGAGHQRWQARKIGTYPADKDDAATPAAWSTVGVALATRVISRQQYDELVAAVTGR